MCILLLSFFCQDGQQGSHNKSYNLVASGILEMPRAQSKPDLTKLLRACTSNTNQAARHLSHFVKLAPSMEADLVNNTDSRSQVVSLATHSPGVPGIFRPQKFHECYMQND